MKKVRLKGKSSWKHWQEMSKDEIKKTKRASVDTTNYFASANYSLVILSFFLSFYYIKFMDFDSVCFLHKWHFSSRSSLICIPILFPHINLHLKH